MFDLDSFLTECTTAVRASSPSLAMRQVMQRTMRDRAAVANAFGEARRADLVKLHASDELVVLHVVWAPGMHIAPHDHHTWAVIGIYGGDEDNDFFRREHGSIARAGGRTVREGETMVLGPEVIHAVTNPRTQSFTGALHVYGGEYLTALRSIWEEPELTECPASYEISRRYFEEANQLLDSATR